MELEVSVLSAEGLRNADGPLSGVSDPYCICCSERRRGSWGWKSLTWSSFSRLFMGFSMVFGCSSSEHGRFEPLGWLPDA